jgi:hypothetical protein
VKNPKQKNADSYLPYLTLVGGKEVLVLSGDMPERFHTWKRKAEDNSGHFLLCRILLLLGAKDDTMAAYLGPRWQQSATELESMEDFKWESL